MDLFLWLMGDWQEVQAMMGTLDRPVEVEDVSLALVRFAGGALGNVANSALSPRQESHLRLDFQRATVEVSALYRYTNATWRCTLPDGAADSELLAAWQALETDVSGSHRVQLAEARRVQAESGRKYVVYFGERFGNRATVKAGELVQAGAIGRVVQTVGFGPHRLLGHVPRPDWTFQRPRFGGIINDLASHQIDQFLYFTGSTSAEILAARTANVKFSQYPDFEDFGELLLRSGPAVATFAWTG